MDDLLHVLINRLPSNIAVMTITLEKVLADMKGSILLLQPIKKAYCFFLQWEIWPIHLLPFQGRICLSFFFSRDFTLQYIIVPLYKTPRVFSN